MWVAARLFSLAETVDCQGFRGSMSHLRAFCNPFPSTRCVFLHQTRQRLLLYPRALHTHQLIRPQFGGQN